MTPEERQLIAGLFDRMRSFSLPEKDREADALISEQVRAAPDAPYMLVQSVLVQEHALQEAASRIKALEEQVRTLEAGAHQQAPGAGSFLGGLFGGGRPVAEPARGSVPQVGSKATPSVYDSRQPLSPPGAAQPSPFSPQAAPGGGGGFLRTAMATAAGVAGGMLVAGAIRDMMGGSSAQAAPAAADKPAESKPAESNTANSEPAQEEPQQAVDEDSSWFGDDGGGDFDI
jgi:uncharacterized protein